MNSHHTSNRLVVKNRPAAVEVLGLPGTGKTTLRAALSTRSDGIVPLSIYLSPRRVPLFVRSGLSLVPMSVRQSMWKPSPRKERIWMIRLEASPRVLMREGTGVVVFDQGPVYTMTRLREAIPEVARSPSFQRWWDRMTQFWAETLDLVILLDAPDGVLLRRIGTRPKAHRLKPYSEDRARETLAEIRALHEVTIAELQALRPVRMLRLDTSQSSLGNMVDQTIAEFDRWGMVDRKAELSLPSRSASFTGLGDR